MIQIKRYTPEYKTDWNTFNDRALNGSFLFNRNFMEYHSHRFKDCSLLIYYKKKLVALFPLHENDNQVVSHNGLSFGGIIVSDRVHTFLFLQLFEYLCQYLKDNFYTTCIYKPQPIIFYLKPEQVDLLALYQVKAILQSRTILSVLDLTNPILYSKLRKRCLKKAGQYELEVKFTNDIPPFMSLVQFIYKAANIIPAHTVEELTLLKTLFPENIKLLGAYYQEELVGGVILFEHNQVVNLQYIATSPLGKKMHALDVIIYTIINLYQGKKRYINFGTSQDTGPFNLNLTLLQNKESYGTHAVIQDVYQITL